MHIVINQWAGKVLDGKYIGGEKKKAGKSRWGQEFLLAVYNFFGGKGSLQNKI